MLRKLGWKEGTGLGKAENGRVDPITVVPKRNLSGVGVRDSLSLEKRSVPMVPGADDFHEVLERLNRIQKKRKRREEKRKGKEKARAVGDVTRTRRRRTTKAEETGQSSENNSM